MKSAAAFVSGVLVASAIAAYASQISATAMVSCNADGTMNLQMLPKPPAAAQVKP